MCIYCFDPEAGWELQCRCFVDLGCTRCLVRIFEPYIALIKRLAVNEKVDFDTAKILINEYKKINSEVK